MILSDAPRLDEQHLAAARGDTARPAYARTGASVGVVHFGPGAFHRAHQASYLDRVLESDPRWAICAVSLQSPRVRDALAPQDFLYVLSELGTERTMRIIGSLKQVLHGPEQSAAVFARLESRATRLVTISVTEKGYCLDAANRLDHGHPDIVHDWCFPAAPRSLIGWLAEGLRRRRLTRAAAPVILSCDNLPDNGRILRAAVIEFASRRDPSLARFIEEEVAFPRTMVDSITPATDDELRACVAHAVGLTDAWPVQREPFCQWVIEDVPQIALLDWERVGVVVARDVESYDRAKLRLVNGAHSMLAYLGLLRGRETVRDAMQDSPLQAFVERVMREDIAPGLAREGSTLDTAAYIDQVLARLRNPGIRHLLAQIAWDGSKKLPVRLLGTIEDALAAARSIDRLAWPLAAWMRFVVRQARARVAIVDPLAERLSALGLSCDGDQGDVARFLELEGVFAPALARTRSFRQALERAYVRLADPLAALPA